MDIEILVISMDIVDINLKVELSGLYCNYSTSFNFSRPQIFIHGSSILQCCEHSFIYY